MDLEQILARLSEATQDELTSALSAVQTETTRLAGEPVTEETVAQLEALAAARTQLQTETSRRAELSARHASALGELTNGADEDETGNEGADGKAEEGAAATEEGADEGAAADAADAVVAAARRPLGKITKPKGEAPRKPARPQVGVRTFAQMTVSTESGVVNAGDQFTRQSLADALSARANAVHQARGSGKHYVLREERTYPEERRLARNASALSNRMKIESVQQSAQADSLVAAGGLCAPLEVRYEIDVLGETARPVRDALARFGVERGGITYRPAIDGAAQTGATGFWTVANDEADPLVPKTCLELDCPALLEAEIYAVYHCVELPNMTARFDPEWADATVRATRVGHSRLAENQLLTALRAGSKLLTSPKVLGATRDILANLDRAIAYLRNRRRLSNMTPLRAIFPRWVLDMLRADLVNQMATANADYLAMADAQISEWFNRRNVAVSWHLDGLGAVVGPPAVSQQFYSNAVAASVIPEFPDVIEAFLFTEGEWLFLDGGTLDMGVVRDSTLNSRNRYQIFSEEFEGIAFTGVESLRLAMTVDPTGLSAGTVATGGTE